MTHFALLLLSLVAFGLLLLSQARHQRDWLACRLGPVQCQLIRYAGLAVLILAFVLAGTMFGWSYGAIAWFGWMTMAAALVVAANTNRERLRRAFEKMRR